jgi:hypothetical protein
VTISAFGLFELDEFAVHNDRDQFRAGLGLLLAGLRVHARLTGNSIRMLPNRPFWAKPGTVRSTV